MLQQSPGFRAHSAGENNHPNPECRTRTSEFTNYQNRLYIGSEAHSRLVKAVGAMEWIPNFKELQALMGKAKKYHTTPVIHSTAKLSVCSGLDNTCYDISKSVMISVNYFNERLKNINTFEIKATILDTSPLDLIIGRGTIKKLGLVHQVPSQFHNIGKVLIPLSTRLSIVAVSRRRSCKPPEVS